MNKENFIRVSCIPYGYCIKMMLHDTKPRVIIEVEYEWFGPQKPLLPEGDISNRRVEIKLECNERLGGEYRITIFLIQKRHFFYYLLLIKVEWPFGLM